MVANAIEKRVAITVESAFADGVNDPDLYDWDALVTPEGLLAVTEANTDSLMRGYLDNENITVRAADVHSKIRGLRSGATAQIASYLYGRRAGHAAAGSQAARDLLDVVLQATLGGELDGFAAAVLASTDTNPEVDTGQGANIPDLSWGFFLDDSDGRGFFRLIASEAADVLTMATGMALPFTPSNGDTMHAVRDHHPHWPAAEDPNHALHNTIAVLMAGAHAEDLFELRGVKPDLQFGAIEQGTVTKITCPLKLAYFLHDELTLPKPDLAYALQGSPGDVVGSGIRTRCWLAPVGQPLVDQQFWGSINLTLAIEHAAITGPNGIEGVHGWGLAESSYKSGAVELNVPFSRDWRTAAEAGTQYHLLIQVGDRPSDGPWGIYFPCLSFNEDAKPAEDDNRRRQSTLSFLLREAQDPALLALPEDVRERARAKFHLLRLG